MFNCRSFRHLRADSPERNRSRLVWTRYYRVLVQQLQEMRKSLTAVDDSSCLAAESFWSPAVPLSDSVTGEHRIPSDLTTRTA